MATYEEKVAMLRQHGFTVGPRDPRLNTRFPGSLMVVEAHDERDLPTEDGRNGPRCVVGDNLVELVDAGYDFLVSCDIDAEGR